MGDNAEGLGWNRSGMGRRALLASGAWAVPTVLVAASAPGVAASSRGCASEVRQLVFADPGVRDASGDVPTNLLGYSSRRVWAAAGLAVTDSDGVTWQASYFIDTITNTSAYTISDIVMPIPFIGIAYLGATNYHRMLWDDAQGKWLSDWITSSSAPAYSSALEPNAGYAMAAHRAPTNTADPATSAPLAARESWSTFSPYMASTFAFPVGTASVTDSDSVFFYEPALTTLAPGESTSFSTCIWRERGRTFMGFNYPSGVIGTVCM